MRRTGARASVAIALSAALSAAIPDEARAQPASEPPPAPQPIPPPASPATGESGLFEMAREIEELPFQMAGDVRWLTVTAASKREETLAEAPATVAVLTHEDFERHGWQNVAEALRSVPGLYVSWGRDYYYTGVRGISLPHDVDTRILVFLDGHTMNNPWSGSSNASELFTLPPAAIERVEVIRGPSSSMYGSNAFFAVVNIVSRAAGVGASDRSRVLVERGWGSPGFVRDVLTAQHRFTPSLDVSLFAVQLAGDGPAVRFTDMTRPRLNCCNAAGEPVYIDGRTEGTDYERGYNLGGIARWAGLTLQLQWGERLKGLPSAPGDSMFGDPYNSIHDSHGFGELRYRRRFGAHDLLARAYYDRFRARQYLHRDPSDWPAARWFTGDPHTVTEGNDDTMGIEVQGILQIHRSDTLVVGTEVGVHQVRQPTYELDPFTGLPDPRSLSGGVRDPASGEIRPIQFENIAIYGQNDWRPLPSLSVVAGLRFDYNSLFTRAGEGFGNVLSGLAPRAAAIWRARENVTAKLLYGEAFRYPTVFEAYYDDGASVCSNPELRPERLRTIELAGNLHFGPGMLGAASVYYTRVDGLLVQEPVGSCYPGSGPRQHFVNGGTVNVLGAEVSFNVRLRGGVTGFASASVTRADQTTAADGAAPLPNSPTLIASAGATVPLWSALWGDRLVASARLHYVSERLDYRLARLADSTYLRIDASLVARRILGGLFASVTVNNALNVSYRDPVTSSETIPAAIPQEGVGVFGRVGYEW